MAGSFPALQFNASQKPLLTFGNVPLPVVAITETPTRNLPFKFRKSMRHTLTLE